MFASLTAAHLALDTHKLADDDPYHERVYAYNVSVPSVSGIPIDKLADDDPTFLNQGSVSSYDDPLSIAPEISSLADDNPYQRRICAYDDPFSNAPPIEFLADDDPTYLTHLSYMLCLLPSFVIPLASGEGVV